MFNSDQLTLLSGSVMIFVSVQSASYGRCFEISEFAAQSASAGRKHKSAVGRFDVKFRKPWAVSWKEDALTETRLGYISGEYCGM